MKVLDVILQAGGFGEYAKQSSIIIIRKDGKKLDVNIEDLLKGKDLTQNIDVLPGDYVIVRESMF
jgi:polysaccharide export outer membrane protein